LNRRPGRFWCLCGLLEKRKSLVPDMIRPHIFQLMTNIPGILSGTSRVCLFGNKTSMSVQAAIEIMKDIY
jgi:hypothetical protein